MTNTGDDKPKPNQPPSGRRKFRVDFRKNQSRTARDKRQWTRNYHKGDVDQEATASVENVRAKGDLSRKRTIVVDEAEAARLRRGTVVRVRGLIVEVDDGETTWACTVRQVLRKLLKGERHAVTVGDRVGFTPVCVGGEQSIAMSDDRPLQEGVIDEVEPRRTTLMRHYERKLQAIAANVDNVLIVVAAAEPTLRVHLVDRYIVAVHQGDMRPVVCINKGDLDASGEAAAAVERYRAIGYQAVLTSVPDQLGIDELRTILRDQTSVLVGPSGVGKSSLLNALDPALKLKVGTLSDLSRGRHTTTTASLVRWAFGGYVVDTPGMRQFDIAEIDSDELEAYFIEFRGLIGGCRFPDCSHIDETDCTIREAMERGEIFPERYDSYIRIFEECREKERNRYGKSTRRPVDEQ